MALDRYPLLIPVSSKTSSYNLPLNAFNIPSAKQQIPFFFGLPFTSNTDTLHGN